MTEGLLYTTTPHQTTEVLEHPWSGVVHARVPTRTVHLERKVGDMRMDTSWWTNIYGTRTDVVHEGHRGLGLRSSDV